MWFSQRCSPRKGEGNPRQRSKEITTPEDVAAAGPIAVHQLRTTTQTNGSTWHPPHRTDASPSVDFNEPPPLRAGPGLLRSTTRRLPRQIWPKENPGLGGIASAA
uniref:Uncharacterized protein n=1 Tax=Oryza glumipatula TaxID=40148 RepID=A0A0E0BCB3_9ORYZ